MNIKVWIFDFDGVLTDSMLSVYRCSMAVLRHFGLATITFSRFYTTFRMPYMEYYRLLGLPETVTFDEVRAVYFSYYSKLPEQDCVYGVPELLAKIQDVGMPMAVVSAHVTVEIEAWLTSKGLRRHFRYVHGMATDKVAALQQVASGCGYDGFNAAFVGDLPSDMEDAKKAGVIGIGLATISYMESVLLKAGAKYVVNRLDEIADMI